MIFYRTQVSNSESWVTQWEATAADARAVAKRLVAAGYHSPHVDKIEIDPNRESILQALNHASVHRMNWDGEEIK